MSSLPFEFEDIQEKINKEKRRISVYQFRKICYLLFILNDNYEPAFFKITYRLRFLKFRCGLIVFLNFDIC